MSIVGKKAFAFDIAVNNSDGVTIFYNYINDGKELEVTNGSTYYHDGPYSGIVAIPEEVTYMDRTRKVTRIGNETFWACRYLTSVTIPNSVTSIGKNAFGYCDNLTSITIPSSLKSIEYQAFYGCTKLEIVIVKDIASWCNIDLDIDALNYNAKHLYSDESTEITNLEIPQGVTMISDYAFQYFKYLTSITIPNSVTSIGSCTFRKCGFTSVDIPESVTKIGDFAFDGCSNLKSIEIPNSVIEIGEGTFSYCNNLTSVTISKNVKSIGRRAFFGPSVAVKTVISMIEQPFPIIGKNSESGRTFSLDTYNNATLYVPLGTISAYKTTEGWKDFLFIEEGLPTGINNVGDKTIKENKRYTIDGKIINSPQKGINIIQMENGTIQKRVIK